MSRKKNALRNIAWGGVNKVVTALVPFVTWTIMIQVLGSEYLGLNSLFTSILQVLNISELGVSSAIVYSMYRPIAEHDTEKINALLEFYKKCYRWIGLIILLAGLALMPFLRNMIEGQVPDDINIYVLYLIFLANAVVSYLLFAYKKSLMEAMQRSDMVSNINSVMQIVQLILQIVALVVFRNYYLFAGLLIVSTVLTNVMYEVISRKYFAEYRPEGEIDKKSEKEIRGHVGGILVLRICGMTRNSFDSIFISMLMGLVMVAVYNNYLSIIMAATAFMAVLTSSVLAGVGESIATEAKAKNFEDMNKINFYYMWVAGWTTIALFCLFQPFMKIWMGEEMMLPMVSVVLFCLYYYCLKMGDVRAIYVDAAGLWKHNRLRAILEVVSNVVLNLVFGMLWGVNGILIATLLSLFVFGFIGSTMVIFKHYFVEEKMSGFLMDNLKYFIVTVVVGGVTFGLCELTGMDGVMGLVVKGLICVSVPNILFMVFYAKNKYFRSGAKFAREKIVSKK